MESDSSDQSSSDSSLLLKTATRKKKKEPPKKQKKVALEYTVYSQNHDCFQEYDTKFKPVGQTLPSSVRAYRVEVFLALAEAGIAYNKVDNPAIKRLLERDRTTLGKDQ